MSDDRHHPAPDIVDDGSDEYAARVRLAALAHLARFRQLVPPPKDESVPLCCPKRFNSAHACSLRHVANVFDVARGDVQREVWRFKGGSR